MAKVQRTKRSIRNVAVSMVTSVVTLLTAFVVQKVLIRTLGGEYNGVNGLFSNIMTMMSLADLGLGTAIIYHMYRAVAEQDHTVINALLHFYKYCYIVISGIIAVIGVIVAFFIPYLTSDVHISDSLYLIFALFIADCLCSYFLGYKRSLMYADMNNYIADSIYLGVYVLQNATQIFVLLAFRSYILFLIVKSMGKVLSNLLISLYIRHKYEYTKEKPVRPLDKPIKKDIVKKVKGLLFHKVGKLIVTGSDSIVLTAALGIQAMNLYTNYHLIIGGITALLNKAFETLSNTVGNFLLDSSRERRLDVYKKTDFINFWMFGCVSAGMYAVLQPLVTIWLGEDFLFSKAVVLVLVIKFYFEGMRASVNAFKEAAGIFHEDRHMPIVEALTNLAVSILLVRWMGAAGVFLGTIISGGVLYLYSYPKYVCKPLFGMKYREYVWMTLSHFGVVAGVLALVELVNRLLLPMNVWARFFLSGTAAVAIFHVVLVALYGRGEEFRYFVGLVKNLMIGRGENKVKKEDNQKQYLFILKAFAIFSVVCAHSTPISETAGHTVALASHILDYIGTMGVPVFFIISGFLFAGNTKSLKDFWKGKVVSVIFPWLVCETLLWFYVVLRKGGISVKAWFLFIIGYNHTTYYLTILLVLYLLFWYIKGKWLYFFMLLSLFSMVSTGWDTGIAFINQWTGTYYLNPLNWMLFFAVGILIRSADWRKVFEKLQSVWFLWCLLSAVYFGIMEVTGESIGYFTKYAPVAHVVNILMISALSYKILMNKNIMVKMVWVGKASFSIYLLHQFVAGVIVAVTNIWPMWILVAIRPFLVMGITMAGIGICVFINERTNNRCGILLKAIGVR